MKKLLSIIVVALMITALLSVAVSADSYNYNGPWDLEFTIKKADPANVIKDGKIGSGEYEQLIVDRDPNSDGCQFWVGYSDAECFDYAEQMMQTIEYYFSWDEVNGFNFAVKFKPHEIKQVLDINPTTDVPQDFFLQNTGICIDLNSKNTTNSDWEGSIFYAVGKRTDTGKYLLGHYDESQLGLFHNYQPNPEKDLIIDYDYSSGFVTCEWSIPIENVISGNIGEGTDLYFSLSVTAGSIDSYDYNTNPEISGTYVVGLGNRAYYCKQTDSSTHAMGTLSDEIIPGGGNTDGGNADGGNGSGNNGSGNNESGSGNNGGYNGGAVDPVNGDNGGSTGGNGNGGSVKTGDAILVLAAVSAVSAAGAYFSKKRRG